MLIRRPNQSWHAPGSESFDDEAALELLLKDSPDLLPGSSGAPVAVVSQLYVPETGPVDLTAVSSSGAITLVECKLRANPEIRRSVLGQVFAYASGLWKVSYADFDAAYAKRAKMPLAEHVRLAADAHSVDFDEDAFRTAVEQALAQGHVSLVIAVDSITEELRRTIEFVNAHTQASVDLLGIALSYVKDGDIEILVPVVYGDEAVREKARATTRQWTAPEFLAALKEYVTPAAEAGLVRIVESARTHPPLGADEGVESGHFYWGTGKYPSVTAWYRVGDAIAAVWSIYTGPDRTVFAPNFEWMAKRGISVDSMRAFAHALRPLPGCAPLLEDLEAKAWRKRPSIPVDPLFSDAKAADAIMTAITDLVRGERPSVAATVA
jgi:hypothetical protein